MNKIVSEYIIDLLDRKFSFVMNSPEETFLFDLEQFIIFLRTDELIASFSEKLTQKLEQEHNQYQVQLTKEIHDALEIKNELLSKYPILDDSNKASSQKHSFARFNKLVSQENYPYHISANPSNDASNIATLIEILRLKVNRFQETSKQEIEVEIEEMLSDLERLHENTHQSWVNYWRISSGVALLELIDIAIEINSHNSKNIPLNNFENRLNFGRWPEIGSLINKIDSEHPFRHFTPTEKSRLIAIVAKCKNWLSRVYEAIRQEIGTTQLHYQLLNRYKIRCELYNQESLGELILIKQEKMVRNKEDILTRDLALYLFDQGVTTGYRVRYGKSEFDLMEEEVKYPMFVEAKAYTDSKSKKQLLNGFKQLLSYLDKINAKKEIKEAFYVVFKLGKTTYKFPEIVSVSGFTIYPISINIALTGGSTEKNRIEITEEEILKAIKGKLT